MGATFSDWDASLKEMYGEKEVKSLAFVDNVLMGTFPKERSGGDYFVQTVHTNAPGGSSASFTKAKSNGTASRQSKLNITRVSMFQRVGVDLHLMLSGDKASESVIRVSKEFDFGFQELSSKVERRLFRSTSGRIGKVKSTTTVTSATIILEDKADAFNFQPGDKLNFSTADGGGSVRAGGTLSGIATVSSVDYDAGTVLTAGANLSTETGMAVGDFIFQDGDYDSCIAGLESWLPVDDRSTKLAASFYGLTRSSNPQRLGGVYFDATQASLDANGIMIRLASELSKHGGKPDLVICPIDFFAELQQIWLTARKGFEMVEVSARDRTADGSELIISRLYPGMRALVGGFRVTIVPSRYCPSNRLYMLQRDTWTLRYVGDSVPCFALEQVGDSMLRVDTWTSGLTVPEVECWLAAYINLGCEAPGKNGVAKLPTA